MDSHHKKGHLGFKIRINMAFKAEKNLAGKKFFIGFLAILDNSKSFGKKIFYINVARRIDWENKIFLILLFLCLLYWCIGKYYSYRIRIIRKTILLIWELKYKNTFWLVYILSFLGLSMNNSPKKEDGVWN